MTSVFKETETDKNHRIKNVLCALYAPVQGNPRAKKGVWVGRGLGRVGMGNFWDSIENVNEQNT
jgi:hypothetical protein